MKKKIFRPKILLFIGLSILILAGVVFAIDIISEGYELKANSIKQVKSPTACYQATNAGSNDYFVPTKTTAELASFISNLPGDVSAVLCSSSSLPPRISAWPGKVNTHTAPSTGVWTVDPDCSSGAALLDTEPLRVTYCRKFHAETIGSPTYAIEAITAFTTGGCVTRATGTMQSYECVLCSEYDAQVTCDGIGCDWHYYYWGCSMDPCTSYGVGDCENMGCYWSGSNCLEAPSCYEWYDETECDYDDN